MSFTETKLEATFIELPGQEEFFHHLGYNIARKPRRIINRGRFKKNPVNTQHQLQTLPDRTSSHSTQKYGARMLVKSNKEFTMNDMYFRILRVALVFLISNLYILFPVYAQKADKPTGVYDGNIGSDKIILVAESENADFMKGYFVLNRGKAVEEV